VNGGCLYAPRAQEDSMRSPALDGRFRPPLNFTVRCQRRGFSQSWFLRYGMLRTRMVIVPVALAVGLISCAVAVAPAPGSEKVRLTRNASEVSSCSAVGNIGVKATGSSARTEFRNGVVGLGGNAGLVTSGPMWAPVEGIAYRCP
jgi:hypothetical protein